MKGFFTLKWKKGRLYLLDQTKLPHKIRYVKCSTTNNVYLAIKDMTVRGAPAIGMAAAYGLAIAAKTADKRNYGAFYRDIKSAAGLLAKSRPTAVNLFWAINRIENIIISLKNLPVEEIANAIEQEALLIQKEDEEANRKIGENLLSLLKDGDTILTHCNAGSLAAAKYGTALAPVYIAKEKGISLSVYVCETRPRMQGAFLTAFELFKNGIDFTLICDDMAAAVMSQGKVSAVITGCDRIAANGDAANKIGTLGLSVLAKHFRIPMYIAAPLSTFDMNCKTGADIPVEERPVSEITEIRGHRITPKDVKVYNPAFDITPAENITAIITQKGIIYPPYKQSFKKSGYIYSMLKNH